MFKLIKTNFLNLVSALLLFVAATGVTTTCWFHWYQPELPKSE